jgi:hypothetical protein
MFRRAIHAVLCCLLLASVGSVSAEQADEYPHGSYEDDCTICHAADSWKPAVIGPEFDHSEHGFPLLGAHGHADCRACHASLEFDRAEPACVSCHPDVHRNELGTDCGRCHNTRSFIDRAVMTRAHLTTRFPLRGVHRSTDCEDCHAIDSPGTLQWVNTPVDCQDCHRDEYLATDDPDHQASGFPLTCESCHRPTGWVPASFNHNLLPAGSQCVECHLDDYQGTTDPDHAAATFPQTCEICHDTRRWVPATFDGLDHDGRFFPIYSGKHRGKWDTCSDCHVNPNNFAAFECIFCHEHDNAGELANEHDEVSGYQYNSQACFNCHPRGDS